MTVFFTADTHFGDHRVLNIRGGRPFGSTAEMDAALVERWNARVGPDDEVWHLGDVARTPALAEAAAAHLAGTKHLLLGNLDVASPAAGFASVGGYAELELDGVKLVLCHYPFRSWNGQHRGALDLHGHSHGRLTPLPRQFDVGVDVWHYAPVTLAELLASRPARARLTAGEEAAADASRG